MAFGYARGTDYQITTIGSCGFSSGRPASAIIDGLVFGTNFWASETTLHSYGYHWFILYLPSPTFVGGFRSYNNGNIASSLQNSTWYVHVSPTLYSHDDPRWGDYLWFGNLWSGSANSYANHTFDSTVGQYVLFWSANTQVFVCEIDLLVELAPEPAVVMPVTDHTVTLTANGTDQTALLLRDSVYVRTSISNNGDVARFIMRDAGTYTPGGWHEILITVSGVRVFGGYIVNRVAKDVGIGSSKAAHWDVTCRDWTSVFEQTVINYGYSDTDDTAIISDLFSRYLSAEGFDAATNVTNVKDDIDIYFENITFKEALEQLASVCGADWHVSPDKSLYWYATDTPADAIYNIDTVTPNDTGTFNVLADTVDVAVDETGIINRATVVGGERLLPVVTDNFSVDGSKTFYALTQKPNTINYISYIIGGTVYYARSEDVGIEPADSLRYNGGNYDVLVNLENRYITVRNQAGTYPDTSTGIVANYYPSETVTTTVESTASQGEYGRVFAHTIYDENLTSNALATDYAQRIIDEYESGRTTVTFSLKRHGLLPGRLITLNIPVLEIEPTTTDRLETEQRYNLLQESGDWLLLERHGSVWKFLIQEVEYFPSVTQTNQFMIVSRVRVGKYVPSLFDTLKRSVQASTGRLPAKRTPGRLSTIAADIGEVRAGRAVFTDGGTAAFDWSDYADHTGLIVGLEGVGSDVQGAMYILQDGTVKAKVGNIAGLGSVGTVTPSGWGIWTDNGFFTGALNATSGQIGGWTIAANAVYANGGTVSTRVPPVNSSNPGVYMSTAGIFGYGTLGLTFSIPADPALRPVFSSGTILETVYEVTNAAVIRTGTINPRVQVDNSGIFAYNSGGTALFTVDAATGRMTASDGTFSGSVTASQISGGTVTGGQISGGTVTGALVTGGTLTAFGGSVSISDTLGVNLICAAGTSNFDDQRFIRWRNQTSDAVAAQIGAASTVNANEMYLFSGTAGTINSSLYMRAYGTIDGTAGDYSTWGVRNDIVFLDMVRSGIQVTNPIIIGAGSVVTGGSVYPRSSNVYSLGGTANAWTALYLHDGTDEWRVTINTSGVLTTVKV
jgi:hypothetical protein